MMKANAKLRNKKTMTLYQYKTISPLIPRHLTQHPLTAGLFDVEEDDDDWDDVEEDDEE